MSKTICTDALITPADVERIKADVGKGIWKLAVFEMVVREPELIMLITERFDKMLGILERRGMTAEQRDEFSKQMSLLVWTPLILLSRAHRREWDSFLPSTEVLDDEPNGVGQ